MGPSVPIKLRLLHCWHFCQTFDHDSLTNSPSSLNTLEFDTCLSRVTSGSVIGPMGHDSRPKPSRRYFTFELKWFDLVITPSCREGSRTVTTLRHRISLVPRNFSLLFESISTKTLPWTSLINPTTKNRKGSWCWYSRQTSTYTDTLVRRKLRREKERRDRSTNKIRREFLS